MVNSRPAWNTCIKNKTIIGAGDVVLLVESLPTVHRDVVPLVESLPTVHRALALHLPGHGGRRITSSRSYFMFIAGLMSAQYTWDCSSKNKQKETKLRTGVIALGYASSWIQSQHCRQRKRKVARGQSTVNPGGTRVYSKAQGYWIRHPLKNRIIARQWWYT